MRRAPYLRPIRHLFLPCRLFSAAATGASEVSPLKNSCVFSEHINSSGRRDQSVTPDVTEATLQSGEGASASATPRAKASTTSGVAQPCISSSSEKRYNTPWTVEKVHSFLQRYEYLFDRAPLLSSASRIMGLVTTPLLEGVKTTMECPQPLHRRTRDVSSRRGFRASAEAVEEIQLLLDRLAQDPLLLSSLHEKQRHRLVTEACYLGYTVGLYSRCCALYVNTILLARDTGISSRDKQMTSLSTSCHACESVSGFPGAPRTTAATGDSFHTPDFIIDAAGEAGDLGTLHTCLLHGTHTSLKEATTIATPKMLTALHVYAQCVRVLLRHGWGSFPALRAKDVEGTPIESVMGTTAAAHDAPGAPAETSKRQRWNSFACKVLHHLRIDADDVEDFLHTSLWRGSYRDADTGGDWGASQSCVYAQVFHYWLDDEREEEASANRVSLRQRLRRHERKVEGEAKKKCRESAPVLLTVPALVTLLRTAVVARQHDVAEWATLCVDACLEEWIRDSYVTAADTDKDMPNCTFDAASHRIAAPLSVLDTPFPQSLPQLDTLLALYLRYLQQSSQHSRAVRWLSRLRRRQSTVPILSHALMTLSVAREAARLASDNLDSDLAIWCLQLCLGDTTSVVSPGHADVFQCLCAYARCGLPNFDVVLQSLSKNELLSPTPEEVLFLRLLHARRSLNWRTEWERCVSPYVTEEEEQAREQDGQRVEVQGGVHPVKGPSSLIVRLRVPEPLQLWKYRPSTLPRHIGENQSPDEAGGNYLTSSDPRVLSAQHPPALSSVFSPRVIHLALLILQEGEHPAFMSYYRTFLLTFSERITPQDRARWVVLAVMWAIQLQGSARSEDVVYIAREVEQLTQLQQAHTRNATASLPPISSELWHSLSRKWATLYQQYPPSLWQRAAMAETQSASDARRGLLSSRLLCTPSAAALATTPVFTRFSKRRHLLPSVVISSTDLLRTSIHSTAQMTCGVTCSDKEAAAAHWLPPDNKDLNLWVNYVESVHLF